MVSEKASKETDSRTTVTLEEAGGQRNGAGKAGPIGDLGDTHQLDVAGKWREDALSL